MTDTFPLAAQGISLDNPLYYALKQSPTPSPVELINKEIPAHKDASETPVHSREFVSNFIKNLNLGSNESDEIKLRPRQSILPCDKFQACWLAKEKAKTCEVSPLARRLAWLRLNNGEKSVAEKSPSEERLLSPDRVVRDLLTSSKSSLPDFSMTDTFFQTKVNNFLDSRGKSQSASCNLKTSTKEHSDCETKRTTMNQRVGDILVGSSVINILNTNHDREKCENVLGNISSERPDSEATNLEVSRNNADGALIERPNGESQLNAALKRRGVIFNERTFELNTPPASDSDEKMTKTSSCCTSVDLDKPSTLTRQKVIRRRRLRSVSDENLPLCKRVADRHPISYLTLPKGLPSPFDIKADQVDETPKSTRSKSASQLHLTSPKKVTFGSLYDIEYSDNGENPSFLGLTLPKGIPSPPSPGEEEIPGVRPLDFDNSVQTGNKRKSEVATSASDCSEETWDSHKHYLKTPRLSENFLNDVSFAESSRTKSPASSKANDEEDNDDDFSSLGEALRSTFSDLLTNFT